MSLITYQEARPWAKAIRNEVMARRMPPFDPVKGIGDFKDDPSLAQPEIDLFVTWVEGGAPEGPAQSVPAQPMKPNPSHSARCTGQELRVSRSTVLKDSVSLCGLRADGPLEVTALLPDQTVRRLIWIRDFHREWNRDYVLRMPELFPKGTRILVHSPTDAAVRLLITHPPVP